MRIDLARGKYVDYIIGFMIGYLIATKSGYRFFMIIVFLAGILVGYFSKGWTKKFLESIK